MGVCFRPNPTSIICPKCHKVLAKVDVGKQRYVVKIACYRCNKWVWYYPEEEKYEVHNIPERNTSSGCRFY